jgi:hypothetical protein
VLTETLSALLVRSVDCETVVNEELTAASSDAEAVCSSKLQPVPTAVLLAAETAMEMGAALTVLVAVELPSAAMFSETTVCESVPS